MMKRYLFIGALENSKHCLRTLFEAGIDVVGIMCLHVEAAKFNSDYCDLGETVKEFGKPVHYFYKIKDEFEYIKAQKPDIIFVLGLSQIIPKEILEIPTIGCLGIHPTLLPANRGRHPIIWALANGLTKSGVTLFWLDEGVDTGDIWVQESFEITSEDDARSVYDRVTRLSIKLLKQNISDLEKGIITRIKQDSSQANSWRKRDKKDGEIDWRMSSKRIYDLTRALARPYPGVHCLYKGKECKVWKIEITDPSEQYKNLEPGKILALDGRQIKVKTGDGLIVLIDHELDPLPQINDYL